MTTHHPLFDFMPYGAPELLHHRDRRLLTSFVLAALLTSLIAATIGLLVPRVPMHVIDVPSRELVFFPRQESLPERAIEKVAPSPAKPLDARGEVIPVDEALPEISPVTPPLAGGANEHDVNARGDVAGSTAEPASPGAPALPARGEWVFHDQRPAAAKQVTPDYPDLARSAGIEGRVLVHVLVGTDGRVIDAEVDTRYQVPMLNASALAAAKRWVFTPALANGHAVAVWVSIPFDFRLN